MGEEVVEVELVFGNLLLKALCLFLVVLLLHALNKRYYVAHAENTVSHTGGAEWVDSIELFARTHKLDRLIHHGANGECSTTAGVTVELGEHYAIEVEAVVELLGGVHCILSGHCIDHEERFGGVDCLLYGFNLLHHLLIYCQTSGGIDDYEVVVVALCLVDSVEGYVDGVLAVGLGIHRHCNLLTEHTQLLDSGRTVNVASHEQWALAFLAFELACELARESGLTRTLQTRHENDGRLAFNLKFGLLATHEQSQLVVHDFHHQFAWLEGVDNVLTHSLSLHGVGELLGDFIVNVGIEKSATYFFQRLGNVDFGDFALTF